MPISPRASPIGLPALRASSSGELLVALLERVGQAVQQPRAVAGRDRAPRRERRLGPRDGGVDVLAPRARDLREHLLGRRLEDPSVGRHPTA